ncbi:MAG: hypothetical protein U0521_07890 [Anaerolineae bacterium]
MNTSTAPPSSDRLRRGGVIVGEDAVGEHVNLMIGAEGLERFGVLRRDGDYGVRLSADAPLEGSDAPRLYPRIDGGGQAAEAAALHVGDHLLKRVLGIVRVVDQFGIGLQLPDERQIDRHFQPLELDQVEARPPQQVAQAFAEARRLQPPRQVGLPAEQQVAQAIRRRAHRRRDRFDAGAGVAQRLGNVGLTIAAAVVKAQ